MTTPTNNQNQSTGSNPEGGAAATAAKPKKKSKAADITIAYAVRDAKGIEPEIARAIKEGRKVLIELPKPGGINDKNVRSRIAYKPAVRAALETAKTPQAATDYNNKDIHVIALHDNFHFNAKVEQVTSMKVTFGDEKLSKG